MLIIYSKNGEVKEFNITDRKIINVGIAAILILPDMVYANPISSALNPLIVVLQDLAEPVSYGFMVKGFLQIMAGDDHAGQKTIKSAIGGFLGIQFIPKIFSIIRGIKI